jgi:NADH-quinone oxidoreductase subunit A
MSQYLPIFTMLVLATLFAALSFVASSLLGPKNPNKAKEAPYECGIVPSREPAQRFPVRFYLVAMIFIVFDIEIIFIYPWAVIFRRDLNGYGLVEMVLSAAIILIPFIYLIANGALDWGPINRVRSLAGVTRTTEGSVRRVAGGPGGQRLAAPAPNDEAA